MAADDKKSIDEILDDEIEEEAEMMINKIMERVKNYYNIVEVSQDCTEVYLKEELEPIKNSKKCC